MLGFIRRDILACHTLLDPGVGKLLQYWVQKARAVLGSYPGAAPACWSGALEVPLAAHQELALLAAAASGGSTSAAALGEALREQLLPRAVQLLVACLGATTAEDKLRVNNRDREWDGALVHGPAMLLFVEAHAAPLIFNPSVSPTCHFHFDPSGDAGRAAHAAGRRRAERPGDARPAHHAAPAAQQPRHASAGAAPLRGTAVQRAGCAAGAMRSSCSAVCGAAGGGG